MYEGVGVGGSDNDNTRTHMAHSHRAGIYGVKNLCVGRYLHTKLQSSENNQCKGVYAFVCGVSPCLIEDGGEYFGIRKKDVHKIGCRFIPGLRFGLSSSAKTSNCLSELVL